MNWRGPAGPGYSHMNTVPLTAQGNPSSKQHPQEGQPVHQQRVQLEQQITHLRFHPKQVEQEERHYALGSQSMPDLVSHNINVVAIQERFEAINHQALLQDAVESPDDALDGGTSLRLLLVLVEKDLEEFVLQAKLSEDLTESCKTDFPMT